MKLVTQTSKAPFRSPSLAGDTFLARHITLMALAVKQEGFKQWQDCRAAARLMGRSPGKVMQELDSVPET